MEPIRTHAVTFDVGGTLIRPHRPLGHVIAGIAREQGVDGVDDQRIQTRFSREWAGRSDFHHTEEAYIGLVRRCFEGFLTAEECRSVFRIACTRLARADAWRIYDDVIPALDDLAGRGFRLGLVSNWNSRLRRLLGELRLLSYFETVSISGEVGFLKPSPVLFEHVLRNLGLSPSMVVHVGSTMVDDVDGAETAGITGILLQRSTSHRSGSISRLTELSPLLEEGWSDRSISRYLASHS